MAWIRMGGGAKKAKPFDIIQNFAVASQWTQSTSGMAYVPRFSIVSGVITTGLNNPGGGDQGSVTRTSPLFDIKGHKTLTLALSTSGGGQPGTVARAYLVRSDGYAIEVKNGDTDLTNLLDTYQYKLQFYVYVYYGSYEIRCSKALLHS